MAIAGAAVGAYFFFRRRQTPSIGATAAEKAQPAAQQPQSSANTQNTTDMNNNSLPRGYRNNNPLNIRISSSAWKGKVSPNTDGAFEQFVTMAYGFRAAFVLIRTYITKYGCDTIRKIISRWAPSSENNTAQYISHVAQWSGINADTVISPADKSTLVKIVYAMAKVENGYYPSMNDIEQGWNLI